MKCRLEEGLQGTTGESMRDCGIFKEDYDGVWCIYRAHESWGLPEPPDYVTFAKRLLSAGYYFKADETHEVCQVLSPHPLTLRGVVRSSSP